MKYPLLFLIFSFLAVQSFAQDLGFDSIIQLEISSEDSSSSSKELDEFKCFKYAVKKIGYNPLLTLYSDIPIDKIGPDGSFIKGAAFGSLLGLLLSFFTKDIELTSITGAITGGMGGIISKSVKEENLKRKIIYEKQRSEKDLLSLKFIYCECLQKKGYLVKPK